MKKLLLALCFALASTSAWAQNNTCANRPPDDNSNACANTRFVQSVVSGSGINYCPAADKTGSTDAYAALQSCTDASSNVYLTKGTYNISQQLTGHSNLTFGGDPGTVIRQTSRDVRGFYGSNLTNIEINDITFRGEGTFCGNVGQAVTAACPSGVWTGDGGINGHNGRGIQFDNCINCRINRVHTQNWGTAGIALYGGKNIFIDQPFIEGTNLYSTAITSQGNFQYGMLLDDDPTYGAIDNLVVTGFNISGTAQAVLVSNDNTSTIGKSRQIMGGIAHDITGQHAIYASTGDYVITGIVCTNVANACIKNQIVNVGYDPYNFTATSISADTIGSNMFEITVLGGTGQHNIHLQGVSNAAGRGLAVVGPVTNLTADVLARNTTGEVIYVSGDGPKDLDITVQSTGSAIDGVLVTATNADRIRFHHPIIRQPNTSNTGRWGFLVASASANVTIFDPVIADSGGLMVNGLANSVVGGTVKVFGSVAITGASGTCVSATGTITAWPIWLTLSCTGGNYTGAANISRGALGDTSIPFTNLVLGGSTSGTLNLRAAAVSGTSDIRFPSGTTDFSATGGASQVVRQSSSGGPLTVSQLACSDLTGAGSGCSAGAGITALTGDVTASGTGSVPATLATTIVAGGPTGSGSVIPVITYDAKGRLTLVTAQTSTPAIANVTGLGTGIATALAINTGSAGAPVLFNGAGGTPSSITLTNANGTAASLTAGTATNATNIAITDDNTTNATMNLTWVTSNTGNLPAKTSSSKLLFTPSSGILTANGFAGAGTGLTGTATSLTAGNVTTNANLTGAITSVGNATSLGSFSSASLSTALTDETGSGSAVFGTSPILSTVDARGTWTTGTSWTLPAHTWAGTVSGGGNQLNNTVLGAVTPLAATVTTLGSGAHTITSASATALTVGPNGTSNPALLIDASAASAATGIQLVSKIAGGGLNITTISSGTNEDILFNAKGSGIVYFASASTGGVDIGLGGGLMNVRSPATFTNATIKLTAIASDAASTDSTMCLKSSDGTVLKGSGTLGICLGTSSERFKQDIAPMGAGLTEIVRLAPKNFFYKKGQGDDNKRQQYGFIAEEVIKVLPGVTAPDEKGRVQSVDMLAMVPILVNAIKQLKADNDNLRMDVLALQAKSKANAK